MRLGLTFSGGIGFELKPRAFVCLGQFALLCGDMCSYHRHGQNWAHLEKTMRIISTWDAELQVLYSTERILNGWCILINSKLLALGLHFLQQILGCFYFSVRTPNARRCFSCYHFTSSLMEWMR